MWKKILITTITAAVSAAVPIVIAKIFELGFNPNPYIVQSTEDIQSCTDCPQSFPSNIDLRKDIKVFDMRGNKPVAPHEQDRKISPTNLFRYIVLQKKSEEVKSIDFEIVTDGLTIDAQCLTHLCTLHKPQSPEYKGESSLFTSIVRVNLERDPIDKDILIVIEATYWNTFTNKKNDKHGLGHKTIQSEFFAIVALAPRQFQFSNIKLLETKSSGSGESPPIVYQGPKAFISHNKKVLSWKIENPTPNSIYDMEWDWEETKANPPEN